MTATELRDEALLMLQGKGAILDVARKVSRILKERGAVIGGIAVVLHGHVRTTNDVDVYVTGSLPDAAKQIESAGATFSSERKEFSYEGVPIHFVTAEQAAIEPRDFVELDGVRTVSLSDLINLKLHSGMRNLTRAQDLADVIGLIRVHQLGTDFAARLHKSVRSEFKKLAKAVQNDPR
jgi:hypothetical protein